MLGLPFVLGIIPDAGDKSGLGVWGGLPPVENAVFLACWGASVARAEAHATVFSPASLLPGPTLAHSPKTTTR